MLSEAQAKKQRKELLRDIAREHKRKDRARLAELRATIREAKSGRKTAMREAVTVCRAGRLAAKLRGRERALALREQAREAIKAARLEERLAARSTCNARKVEIRESAIFTAARVRETLKAERKLQRELHNIENRMRKQRVRSTSAERLAESDDEVRHNIPADLVPYFERVKRMIKGDVHQSRTESFLAYAEENPNEVIDAQEALSQREIAKLLREQHALEHAMRSPRRYRPTAAELAAIPF